jgi:hypothetical protein
MANHQRAFVSFLQENPPILFAAGVMYTGRNFSRYTDKKENKIFIIYSEIQSGAVAKSYMRKGSLIYEEMRKYFPIYEEAVSHI